jgi:sugar/nucleoside kinase (ribokinase family)
MEIRRGFVKPHGILCIGSALVDIKAFSNEEVKKGSYQQGRIELTPGGVAFCMAVNLAHLGLSSAILTVLGNDIFGEYIKESLVKNNVDITLLHIDSKYKTAAFSVITNIDSSSYSIFDNDIFQDINIDMQVRKYIDGHGIDVLILDSNISERTLETLYEIKREKNLFVFQNATSPIIARKSLPYASFIDIFACNEHEARAILGEKAFPDYKTANIFSKLGFHSFIITFGDKGVLIGIGEDRWIEKPYKPEDVIDTIGAGDAFASGFLFGFLTGKPIEHCIRYGLVCARETIATFADTSNVINPDFIEQYIKGSQGIC